MARRRQGLLWLVDCSGSGDRVVRELRPDHCLYLWRVPQAVERGVWLEPVRGLTGVFPFPPDVKRSSAIHRPPGGSLWRSSGDRALGVALWPLPHLLLLPLVQSLALVRHLRGHGSRSRWGGDIALFERGLSL